MKVAKLRIFKRLREYKTKIAMLREENNMIKGFMIQKRKQIEELKAKIMLMNNDYSDLNKIKIELERRRDEVIKRLKSEIPDGVIGGRFENYKYWIAEPFIVDKYENFVGVNPNEAFVDNFAVMRKLERVVKDEQKREAEDT